jgi:hypothetical protein
MLTINYFPHRPSRAKLANIVFYYLCKIRPEYKSKVKVNILYAGNSHVWENIAGNLVSNGIDTYTAEFPFTLNYMDKVHLACESETEYCCKLDDDVWISNHLWEYILDNLSILDDKNAVISPVLSTVIPVIEDFVEGVGTKEEIDSLYKIFHDYEFIPLWGADYTSLNEINKNSKSWDKDAFYNKMMDFPHYYKGIHPARMVEEAQVKINDIALNHYDKIKEKQNYSLDIKKVPYLCNNLFFIKTKVWKEIINDQSLFKDAFDEVPLNLYIHKNNMNYVFTKEGYGVHIFYNCVKNFESLTDVYYDKYIKLL